MAAGISPKFFHFLRYVLDCILLPLKLAHIPMIAKKKTTKAKRRRTLDNIIRFTTVIGETSRFEGKLSGDDDFVIRGHVRGDCDLQGNLVIAENGRWIGRITANNIVIAGEIEGEINASEKLEICATARIRGNINSPVIAMSTGAKHDGEIHMCKEIKITEFEEKRSPPVMPDTSSSD